MKMLDLSADAGNRERAKALVTGFFAALSKGDWEGASTRCVDPLVLLGKVVTQSQLALGSGSAFGPLFDMKFLPAEVAERFEDETAEQVFGQVLQRTDAVVFVTVPLTADDGEGPATYGVIIDGQKPTNLLVKALFDPSRFKTLSEWLAAAE